MVVALRAVRAVRGVGRHEDPGHRVVVALRDRVELVVVAAGAGNGGGQDPLAECIDLLVHHVEGELRLALRVVALGAHRQVAGGDELLGPLLVIGGGQQVARELLAQEAVVGLVGVERGDHVVAVAPRVRVEDVRFLAARFREPRNVQPMAAPALAEARGGKQLVHQVFVRAFGTITLEGLDLLRRGRQAGEVEAQAADQRAAVGIGSGRKTGKLHAREHELVHRRLHPRAVVHEWRRGLARGLVAPELAALGNVQVGAGRRGRRWALHASRAGRNGRRGLQRVRMRRAHRHPLLERLDGLGRELCLGRHLEVLVVVSNRGDEQAVVWVTRDDRWSGVAAGQDGGQRIELEAALQLGCAVRVALVAMVHEHRPHALLKELDLRGGGRRGHGTGGYRGS